MSTIVRVRLSTVNRRVWISVALFTLGLVLAIVAQRAIYDTRQWLAGAWIYASAFMFLVLAWTRERGMFNVPISLPLETIPVAQPAHPVRKYFVLPAILFAFIAFIELTNNRFTLGGTLAWLTALALFLVSFWEGSPAYALRQLRAGIARQSRWVMFALAGIVLLGSLFYFFRLDVVPAEMTSDHAEKILDTYDILHGKYSIFFERNTGREPLQFYLNALVVALGIAPLDMLALKVVGATAGVLTIPAVFLLARELFDEDVGLVAAFLFACSIFPVAIARIGLRYPLNPLFVAWTCFFLVRAFKRQSRNDFLLAGLMIGLGLNGYSPFRAAVLLVGAWIILWGVWGYVRVRELPSFFGNVIVMFGAGFMVFVPLFRYITDNPGMFAYRMATRLTSLEVPVQGNPVLTFIDNNWRALGMFNLHGDVVWVNSVPNVPSVDWVIGACFLLGVIYGAYRLLRFGEYAFAMLFVALFIMLLPSTLSFAFPEENPSVVRAGGVAPFVMIFAALPLVIWHRQFARLNSRTFGDALLGVVLLIVVWFNFNLYFTRYDQQYREASWNSTEIAATLKTFADAHNDYEHIYIVSYPHWVDHRAVGMHLRNYDFDDHLIENQDTLKEQVSDPAPKLYALKNQDLPDLLLLAQLYPDGASEHVNSRTPGRDFVVFYTAGVP